MMAALAAFFTHLSFNSPPHLDIQVVLSSFSVYRRPKNQNNRFLFITSIAAFSRRNSSLALA